MATKRPAALEFDDNAKKHKTQDRRHLLILTTWGLLFFGVRSAMHSSSGIHIAVALHTLHSCMSQARLPARRPGCCYCCCKRPRGCSGDTGTVKLFECLVEGSGLAGAGLAQVPKAKVV
mmetsp:Transcript_1802/g.2387  ORF Transcript_1802/g.2387 Transcript_1802/m.2387 type:complete len:119 (+) Transcript_1802:153-509(+)